jgi:hypothetical protein
MLHLRSRRGIFEGDPLDSETTQAIPALPHKKAPTRTQWNMK